MIHQSIDLPIWIERFPLDDHLRDLDIKQVKDFVYYPEIDLFSPQALAHYEQWLKKAGMNHNTSKGAVPVDYFLPALGEPDSRIQSKISGLPYLRKGEWPRNANGEPLAFLAQICFLDSHETLPVDTTRLGGAVLLIFQDEPDEIIWSMNYGAQLHFIWMPHGVSDSELISASDVFVPNNRWYEPTHFHRFRSTESPEPERTVTHMKRNGLISKKVLIPVSHSLRATKIGGIPVWQQDESDAEGLGDFLCCIHSINPFGKDYPFVNVPVAPWGDQYSPLNFLMLGDVGTLYLFISETGKISWQMQCG